MLVKTNAIVLNSINYSDNSLICKVFTKDYGLKTFFINNKKKIVNIIYPLSILEITFNNRDNKNMLKFCEITSDISLKNTRFNYYKNTIIFFLSEILSNIIKEDYKEPELFDFINDSIIKLDEIDENIADFHLVFLLKLSELIGFKPRNNFSEINKYFNIVEGHFTYLKSDNSLNASESAYLSNLFDKKYGESIEVIINGQQRSLVLEFFINYYSHHLSKFREIKTLDVLKQCFY